VTIIRDLVAIVLEVLRGTACPVCAERSRNLSAHLWYDHADEHPAGEAS
jgi:hypothetical protein